MPWRDARSVPFTRIDVVAGVPSESGVYGILSNDCCLVVGESWNLKARLLELAGLLSEASDLVVVYELCSDEDRVTRKQALSFEYLAATDAEPVRSAPLPGLQFFIRP